MKTLDTMQITLQRCRRFPNTVEDANKFLTNLVEFIGMRIIPEEMIGQKNPHSFCFNSSAVSLPPEEDGITGTVILYESHAAIHTWTEDNLICIVVSSCKPYERIPVAQFCADYFDSKHIVYT